jgi:hypothetical protein
MNAPPWCLAAPGASLLLGYPELRSGVLVGRFTMPSGLQPKRYMTVTGPAPCRNWAPAILIRLPRTAPIPCEWAPSPDSSALQRLKGLGLGLGLGRSDHGRRVGVILAGGRSMPGS